MDRPGRCRGPAVRGRGSGSFTVRPECVKPATILRPGRGRPGPRGRVFRGRWTASDEGATDARSADDRRPVPVRPGPSRPTGRSGTRPARWSKAPGSPGSAPSPTGHLHIGGVYAGDARQGHRGALGRHVLRAGRGHRPGPRGRGREGTVRTGVRLLRYRAARGRGDRRVRAVPAVPAGDIYLTYVRRAAARGQGLPVFRHQEELAEITAASRRAKVPTGYYGRWALWRDATPERRRRGPGRRTPYVVRFRSPGLPGRRVDTSTPSAAASRWKTTTTTSSS